MLPPASTLAGDHAVREGGKSTPADRLAPCAGRRLLGPGGSERLERAPPGRI
jgi:hypothetical protein